MLLKIYPGEEKYRAVSRCEERYSRRVFVIEGQYLKKALLDNTNNQQSFILQKENIRKNLEEDI